LNSLVTATPADEMRSRKVRRVP